MFKGTIEIALKHYLKTPKGYGRNIARLKHVICLKKIEFSKRVNQLHMNVIKTCVQKKK
jgi:hypothetical protein